MTRYYNFREPNHFLETCTASDVAEKIKRSDHKLKCSNITLALSQTIVKSCESLHEKSVFGGLSQVMTENALLSYTQDEQVDQRL